MSVFLRWGIFGILGVAGLLYAYNASKRMAERHAERVAAGAPVVPTPKAAVPEPVRETPPPPVEKPPPAPAHCEAELVVAQRAIDARKNGDPLDRLLRIQEIAFQEPARRARLETVATRFFNYESDFVPEALRIAVISDCVRSSP